MSQTLIEKIATTHNAAQDNSLIHAGDFLNIRPKHIMTHDNTSAVMGKFKSIFAGGSGGSGGEVSGASTAVTAVAPRIFNPQQPVFAIDHDIQNLSPENLGKYARIEKFANEQGIDFYPAGTGISHQVIVEYGYATPGSMVVGSDSHSNLYGAVSALGTPVVRTDAAAIWATGQTWWQVPQVAKVELTGQLSAGVVGKDVIIALCGVFNNDEVLNMAVEFTGDGVAGLSMDQRMSIANMTTEWGALAGVFPFDEILRDYFYGRADYLQQRWDLGVRDPSDVASERDTPRITRDDVDAWYANRLEADADAHYAVELTLDLTSVIPHVSGPDHVKVMHSLPDIEKQQIKVNKAYLLSCVNARLEDIAEAANIVDGKKVADGVEFYVAAASANVEQQARELGHWQKLLDAGAIELPPGCGTCIGLGKGTLEPGEVAISATNRNFKGRMGSRDAKAYLGSPAVVAASALAGHICSPTKFDDVEPKHSIKVNERPQREAGAVEIAEGFPSSVKGRALWLPVDNLNTDGIYSGKLTYRDDVSEADMAAASMANYDPTFNNIAKEGDIIVAGRNFGTGSSREQAATCLKLRGIPCVIAASFSETYKRNAFNNAFLVLECPELVAHFEGQFKNPDVATIVGPNLEIDFAKSMIECDGKEYSFAPLSEVAQELIAAGGAEALVKRRLQALA
ncbi:MAG: homoaconitase [Planctomycetota bacterium]|nr:homoaconitase [Planctomycetota bacterium]